MMDGSTFAAGTFCEQCGKACVADGFAAGYAVTNDNRRICYGCANEREKADFAKSEAYFAYMSGDGKAVTTWTGERLATVTYSRRHRGGFGGEYFTLDATAPDGSRWYGRGAGPGMYCRLKRRKSATVAA